MLFVVVVVAIVVVDVGGVVVGVSGVVVVGGGGIVAGSGDIVAIVVVVGDDVSEEWLSLLLVSAAFLQLCSISKSIKYCRHFFVSFL